MQSLTNSEFHGEKPKTSLDLIGLMCPEPVYRTRMQIDKMVAGEMLEVFADDPAADDDIRSWIRKSGNQLILSEKRWNTLRFLIRKVK